MSSSDRETVRGPRPLTSKAAADLEPALLRRATSLAGAATKPLTTQKVIAVLKKAGFTKSNRIKVGRLTESTVGFEVTRSYGGDGSVIVIHRTRFNMGEGVLTIKATWCAKYADALEAAGLVVDRTEPRCLKVSRS